MKAFLLLFAIVANSACKAQTDNPFMTDGNGRPLYLVSNYRIEGSPYFIDEYRPAQITLMNGKVYNNVNVKVDLATRSVQYKSGDGNEMVTTAAVKSVLFSGAANVLLTGFNAAINTPGTPVYEVLATGKITLLKKISINYRDEKKYGDAGITRIFERKEAFYVLGRDDEIKKLEKGQAPLLQLFGDKKEMIDNFIRQENLSCKNETDYKKIFSYYNSIAL